MSAEGIDRAAREVIGDAEKNGLHGQVLQIAGENARLAALTTTRESALEEALKGQRLFHEKLQGGPQDDQAAQVRAGLDLTNRLS